MTCPIDHPLGAEKWRSKTILFLCFCFDFLSPLPFSLFFNVTDTVGCMARIEMTKSRA